VKCPICGKAAGPRPENPSGPFCSQRCRLIDLGKWLGGEYRVPVEEPTEEDLEEALKAERESQGGGAEGAPRRKPS